MPLQIEILSRAEVEQIWKNRARAENFAEYVTFLNGLDIGQSFRVTPDKGDKNAESVRTTRHNFNEAAKERTKMMRDSDGKLVQPLKPVLGEGGAPVPDPVILRWKLDSHEEKRKDKAGKEITVAVVDKLTALVIASTDVKPRGPRTEYEVVAVNATEEQKAAGAVILADGRTAKINKKGQWKAPKLAAQTPAAQSTNGTADVSTDGNTGEKPTEKELEKAAA